MGMGMDIKKFFSNVEERFVFPIGRRTWQVIVFLALLSCGGGIVYYLFNSLPTSRDEVSVSRTEVVENRVDTAKAEPPQSECKQEDYAIMLDSLRADLPMAEWKKLGDSSEPEQVYALDEYGNYMYQDGSVVTEWKRRWIRNDTAMPNILDDLYARMYVDSTNVCRRTEIVTILHRLLQTTSSALRWREGVGRFCGLVNSNRNITVANVDQALRLRTIIDKPTGPASSESELQKLAELVSFCSGTTVTTERESSLGMLLDAHRQLQQAKYPQSEYINIASMILRSSLSDGDAHAALKGFVEDLEFYDTNDLYDALSKYLRLYNEKLALAEADSRARAAEKEGNRAMAQVVFLYSFGAVLMIAIILLLFSIQSMLRSHVKSDINQ